MSETVLVPHDGSEHADAALRFALETFSDASVVVLHVVEPFAEHTDAGVEDGGRWRRRAREHAADVFDGISDIVAAFETTVDTVWRYGRPKHVIVRYLEEEGIDQVVMGSRGRSGIDRLLLGSVAETVVRRASVPVTIVHDTDRDETA
ncbi:universal stress protein [Natronorubrum thiooxidans]|uniref:Nucleotide-binding universal stress protein, UspA family n=1 Tax=Natronorubrum thiooxidans TaxID=308853 RepID=A0A1N7DJF1_9EURY|nr:universal stress protein [Natronorubrum thiooxidans]SIR75973.1 Nucleotide-binding universal stress protein, UspA family [Natronorubrum thiooxidans]